MSNTILTSDIAVPFVAQFEMNMPILANGTTRYNNNFRGGNGTSMDVLIPDYGTTVQGADLTGNIAGYANGSKTVTLTQYSKGVALTAVEQTLDLSDFEEQIAIPYAAELASTVQKAAASELLNKADIDIKSSGRNFPMEYLLVKLLRAR